jgi:hypothetical protein
LLACGIPSTEGDAVTAREAAAAAAAAALHAKVAKLRERLRAEALATIAPARRPTSRQSARARPQPHSTLVHPNVPEAGRLNRLLNVYSAQTETEEDANAIVGTFGA